MDPATGTAVSQAAESDDDDDDVMWNVIGSPEAWESVLFGRVNFNTALRRYDLRYCSADGEQSIVMKDRLDLLADVLGLNPWQSTDQYQNQAVGQ